jgi:hypothetical protein
MRTNLLAKTFQFGRDNGLTYDQTKVAVAVGAVLQPGVLSGNVTTKTSTPLSARQLLGFQAFGMGLDRARYQLYDGVSFYYFDATAVWVTAAAADVTMANTEVELAANIATFPFLPRRAIGVRVFLEEGVVILAVKFALSIARVYSYIEDLVYRSLVRDLKAKFLPVLDAVHKMATASNQLDVAAIVKETSLPLTVVGVDYALDRTADPDLLTDLLSSYDATAKTAALSATAQVGHFVEVGLVYQPDIIVEATSPDFQQVERVPAMIISSIEEVESSQMPVGDWVVNKSDGSAIIVKAPYRGTLRFTVTLLAPGGADLHRMVEGLKAYAVQNPILYSRAIDEGYRLFLRDEFSSTTQPTPQGIHSATARFDVMDVLMWKEPSTIVPDAMVRRVVANATPQ